jgi:hypothetical protein
MNDTLYPDVNEPTDGERRLYKITAILIGSLLVAVAVAFAILFELA